MSFTFHLGLLHWQLNFTRQERKITLRWKWSYGNFPVCMQLYITKLFSTHFGKITTYITSNFMFPVRRGILSTGFFTVYIWETTAKFEIDKFNDIWEILFTDDENVVSSKTHLTFELFNIYK